MPGKQDAWREAKRLRDAEFEEEAREARKLIALWDQLDQLVQAGNADGADAVMADIWKQCYVLLDIRSVYSGKLEAMSKLQASDTKSQARNAIARLIKQETRELYRLLDRTLPDFPPAASGEDILDVVDRHIGAFLRLTAIALQIKGKREIATVVRDEW